MKHFRNSVTWSDMSNLTKQQYYCIRKYTKQKTHDTNYVQQQHSNYFALLWQKEASDILSKSELLMFTYFT